MFYRLYSQWFGDHMLENDGAATNEANSMETAAMADALKLARQVRSVYGGAGGLPPGRGAFPSWSMDMLENGQLLESMMGTVIYFDNTAGGPTVSRTQDAALMALLREPVNIGMNRMYQQDQMHALYSSELARKSAQRFLTRVGIEQEEVLRALATSDGTGAYKKSTKEELMPQLAIYTESPMRADAKRFGPHAAHGKFAYGSYETRETTQSAVRVPILSVVGAGFDHPKQPDYQFYFPDGNDPEDSSKWIFDED